MTNFIGKPGGPDPDRSRAEHGPLQRCLVGQGAGLALGCTVRPSLRSENGNLPIMSEEKPRKLYGLVGLVHI